MRKEGNDVREAGGETGTDDGFVITGVSPVRDGSVFPEF